MIQINRPSHTHYIHTLFFLHSLYNLSLYSENHNIILPSQTTKLVFCMHALTSHIKLVLWAVQRNKACSHALKIQIIYYCITIIST